MASVSIASLARFTSIRRCPRPTRWRPACGNARTPRRACCAGSRAIMHGGADECPMSKISVVMPVLDEADNIDAALQALQPLRGRGHEVIIVDGGSVDATVRLAARGADRVIAANRGRAHQMNAGARTASGEILLFLHADTRLPEA